MPAIQHSRVPLTVIGELPEGLKALDAPPVLVASRHTIDYCCGSCGAILMHAEIGQVFGVLIHCMACGHYNATEN